VNLQTTDYQFITNLNWILYWFSIPYLKSSNTEGV
jgi:hypothetical protein